MHKRRYRGMFLILLTIIILAVGIYYFLFTEHSIKLMDEQEVFTDRMTKGLFWIVIWNENDRIKSSERYKVELPKIDFTKYNLLLSDGRRILKLRYQLISKFRTDRHYLIGEEIFDSQHYPHSMFVYRIKKIFIRQFGI